MRDRIIRATGSAIGSIWHPRFYQNERGYGGILYYFLMKHLEQEDLLRVPGRELLEIEYQKSSRHSLTQRPDIIFHRPNEDHREGVKQHNFAVWALKAAATDGEAIEDFEKLDQMFAVLGYPVGFFINIRAGRDCLELYHGQFHDRLYGAWAYLDGDRVNFHLRSCREVSG